MKKLITLSMSIMLLAGSLMATSSDLFSYDKETVNTEMADLNALENYVKENTGVTLADVKANNKSLVANLNISEIFSPNFAYDEPPMGIPSFWWGCCLGVWGIAIVYFISEDKEETKAALKGCVLGTLVGTVIYIALYAWVFTSYNYY